MVAAARDVGVDDAKAAYAVVDADAILKMSSSANNLSNDDVLISKKYSISLYPTSSSQRQRERDTTTHHHHEETVELTTLEQWYEYYAERYPSRGFLERQQQLRQLENEKQRRNKLLDQERRKQQGGWLRRLFFGASNGGGSDVMSTIKHDENQGSSSNDNDYDSENESNQSINDTHDDDGMCGTSSSLDTNAIAKEALALHRFHLVSERRALCKKYLHGHNNNEWHVVLPIRNCVGWDDGSNNAIDNINRPYYCIVGYGKIAEFPALPTSSSSSDPEQINGAKVTLTSDRDALCQFVKDKRYDTLSDLRHTRAALIGYDCLAVSWGRGDGFVVVYRRVQQQKGGGKKGRFLVDVGWAAVAVIAPSDAVVNESLKGMTPRLFASGDDSNDDSQETTTLFESGTLRVTDLMPMVVKSDSEEATSAILAISRLGGCIEFVPVPNQIWPHYSRPPTPPLNQLPNITSMVKVSAISTGHQHIDVTALDAFRTSIGADLGWNSDRNPDDPPAEFVLASCGHSSDDEVETGQEGIHSGKAIVTLWSISTVFLPRKNESDNENPNFNIRVREIKSIAVGQLGADSTVFIPDVTSTYWTKNNVSSAHPKRSRKRKKLSCSITTKAPFTSLRFTPRKVEGVFLAALDYNGGVTVIDSTKAVTFSEYTNNRDEMVSSTTSLLRIISNRELSLSTSPRGTVFTSHIEWWCPIQSGTIHLVSFSVSRKRQNSKAMTMQSKIQLYNFASCTEASGNTITIPVRKSAASNIIMNGETTLLPTSHYPLGETLSFVQFSGCRQKIQLGIAAVRSISDPSQMITLLLERSNPERALFVAGRFGGAEHFGGNVMNECHMKLWEDQMDIRALKLVSDNEYVIGEALKQIGENSHDRLSGVSLDTLLELYREGLDRCRRKLSAEDGADTTWPSTNASQLKYSILSLGTFKLLHDHFMKGSSHEEGSENDSLSQRFFNFQRLSLIEVAECAADNCDIGALTVIFARHRLPLHKRMDILSRIPLNVDLTLFQHLLPCHCNDDSTEGRYLLSNTQKPVFLTPLEFFVHLADAQMQVGEGIVDVFTDNTDRESVVDSFSNNDEIILDETTKCMSKDCLALWYLKRAICLINSTGQIDHMAKVSENGLVRLSLHSSCNDVGQWGDVSSPCSQGLGDVSAKLIYLHLAAQLLGGISEAKLSELLSMSDAPVEALSSASISFRSVLQFCSAGIAGTVSYMSQCNEMFSISMFNEHVKSFLNSDKYIEPQSTSALGTLDGSNVLNMCISKITSVRNVVECKKRKNVDANDSQAISLRLEKSLTMCLYCASLGTDAVPSTLRILRNNSDLIEFANNVFRSMILVVNDDLTLVTDGCFHAIWSIFELLPSPSNSSSIDPTKQSHVGSLYFKLVTLQMCSKWCHCRALPSELKSFFCSEEEFSGEGVYSAAGYDIVAFICKSFLAQVAQEDSVETLLLEFVSDIEELDQRFFSGTIQASGSLGHLLVPSLLKSHSFDTLRGIMTVQTKWIDEDYACSAIQTFIGDRMGSDSSIYGCESAAAALACMKTIGPLFPQLSGVFERQHRLFEAKKFISEAFQPDNSITCTIFGIENPNGSLEIIEIFVQEFPQALLLGCEFWGDVEKSENACIDALKYFSCQINKGNPDIDSSLVLPPMPGAFVMQLASIIEIGTTFYTLMVKKIMLLGSLRKSLVHAAIAICYSMLADAAFADDYTDRHQSELLSCVDAILSHQTFTNAYIKKDLCVQTLNLLSMTSAASTTVLESFCNLEYNSLWSRGQTRGADKHANSPGLVYHRAVERITKQVRSDMESSVARNTVNAFTDRRDANSPSDDLFPLLSCLREGVSPSKGNLEAICQAVLDWVTTESLPDGDTIPPKHLILEMVEFAACCLNELDGDTALGIIDCAVKAFDTAGLQQECSSSENKQIKPDPSIVERLNGRGYGLNASRRAAIMTNNKGYSEALSWAVSHFQDNDFDSPIYFLHRETAAQQIDTRFALNVMMRLVAIQNHFCRPATSKLPATEAVSNSYVENSSAPKNENKPAVRSSAKIDAVGVQNRLIEQKLAKVGSPANTSHDGSIASLSSIKKQVTRGKVVLGTQKLSLDERKKL